MRSLIQLGFAAVCITLVSAAPPNRQVVQDVPVTDSPSGQQHKADPEIQPQQRYEDFESKPFYQFAYSKYLEQVIKILESDDKFRERIKLMNEDEIKIHGDASKIAIPDHIDIYNWEKFHKEDLRKLITKTVVHMEEIDKQRREQFKEYEMKKKAEEDHKLAQLPPDQRVEEQRRLNESKQRHNDHEKVNHPGGRQQLEEVWEESDHMSKDQFDPKTFFSLHDLNGDGYWNDEELEALFQIELEKVYNETDPDDDPTERVEEMHRMREHVVKQMDKNRDRLISLDEFMNDSEVTASDNQDLGWKDLNDQQLYTDEELKKFEEEYTKTQNWSDHSYDSVTAATLSVPIQHQQKAQQVHVEPEQKAVPEKIHKAVDPVYGI